MTKLLLLWVLTPSLVVAAHALLKVHAENPPTWEDMRRTALQTAPAKTDPEIEKRFAALEHAKEQRKKNAPKAPGFPSMQKGPSHRDQSEVSRLTEEEASRELYDEELAGREGKELEPWQGSDPDTVLPSWWNASQLWGFQAKAYPIYIGSGEDRQLNPLQLARGLVRICGPWKFECRRKWGKVFAIQFAMKELIITNNVAENDTQTLRELFEPYRNGDYWVDLYMWNVINKLLNAPKQKPLPNHYEIFNGGGREKWDAVPNPPYSNASHEPMWKGSLVEEPGRCCISGYEGMTCEHCWTDESWTKATSYGPIGERCLRSESSCLGCKTAYWKHPLWCPESTKPA